MKGKRHFGLTFLMIDRVKSGSVKVEQENSTRFRGRSMFYKEGGGVAGLIEYCYMEGGGVADLTEHCYSSNATTSLATKKYL